MDEEVPAPVPPVTPVPPIPVPRTTDQMSDAAVPYVRAALTILLVGAVVAFYGIYKYCPEVLVVMASTAFAYYFALRNNPPNGVSK